MTASGKRYGFLALILPLLLQGCGGGVPTSGANPVTAPAQQATPDAESVGSAAPGGSASPPASPSPISAVVTSVRTASGFLTLFSDGNAVLVTPDLRLLHANSGPTPIIGIASVPGGVQARLSNGDVYLSPDGLSLDGGGDTVKLPHVRMVTDNAEFGPRDSARGIQFGGQMWISGGYYDESPQSYYDIWYSGDDGVHWSLGSGLNGPQSAPPGNFYDAYSPIVSDGQNLFAIGSTVWKSPDGKTWVKISDAGPEQGIDDTAAFYHNGQFTFFDTQYGNFFTSNDAVNWTQSSENIPMKGRCGAATLFALDKFWLFGGGDCFYKGVLNDIWNSTDGVNWSRATSGGVPKNAEWPGRLWPCVTSSASGTLWLFGGYTPADGGLDLSDLWYSRDGLSWTQLTINGTLLQTRHAPTCFIRAGSSTLLVVAGKGGSVEDNDEASVTNTVMAIDLPVDGFLP